MSKTITKKSIIKFIIFSGIILCTSGLLNARRGYDYCDEYGNCYRHHRGILGVAADIVGGTADVAADVVEGTADVVTGDYPDRRCRGRGDYDCYYYRHGHRHYR